MLFRMPQIAVAVNFNNSVYRSCMCLLFFLWAWQASGWDGCRQQSIVNNLIPLLPKIANFSTKFFHTEQGLH